MPRQFAGGAFFVPSHAVLLATSQNGMGPEYGGLVSVPSTTEGASLAFLENCIDICVLLITTMRIYEENFVFNADDFQLKCHGPRKADTM